jgi:hypothetical protein
MIERTRRKLDEARFFYGHLVNERRKTFRHDPLAFRYYFSAFIQAARDVLRRAHYEEKGKWEAWEPKWRAKRSEEEQKLLDLTNELRINEVHRGGVDPPPLKWSDLRYVFDIKEDCNGKEAIQA